MKTSLSALLLAALSSIPALILDAEEFRLELRGLLRIEDKALVNVTDPTTQESRWLPRGEVVDGWTFDGLDAAGARAVFRKGEDMIEVDLVPSGDGASGPGGAIAYNVPTPSWLSLPAAMTVAEGIPLLLGNATDSQWQDYARRSNIAIERGPIEDNGNRSFRFHTPDPGEAPEFRQVAANEAGQVYTWEDGINRTMVYARPSGDQSYTIELLRVRPRPEPPRPAMPFPELIPGEEPAAFAARVMAAVRDAQRYKLDLEDFNRPRP